MDCVTFSWNEMTAKEFESNWKKRNSGKKMHLISMIQVGTSTLMPFSFCS